MKFIAGLVVLVCAVALASGVQAQGKRTNTVASDTASGQKQNSNLGNNNGAASCSNIVAENVPNVWISLAGGCQTAVENQIKEEIKASIAYLKMGAHFSRDNVNLPGFAELFFKAAKEEREHGIHLIEYLSMRGKLDASVSKLIELDLNANPLSLTSTWADNLTGAQALDLALKLEAHVTSSINNLIGSCNDDHHLVDYLSGTYLEEQHKGQRDLAGKLSTLNRMYKTKGALAEFLFDKEL